MKTRWAGNPKLETRNKPSAATAFRSLELGIWDLFRILIFGFRVYLYGL
jgi:hypothetical protein